MSFTDAELKISEDNPHLVTHKGVSRLVAALREARDILKLAHSGLDETMGDSDLDDDDSVPMQACRKIMAYLGDDALALPIDTTKET